MSRDDYAERSIERSNLKQSVTLMEDDLTVYISKLNLCKDNIFGDNPTQSDDEENFTNLQTCAISCETSSAESSRSSSPSVYEHDQPPQITEISRLLELYHLKSSDDVLQSIHDDLYQFIFMTIPEKVHEYKRCRLIRENFGLSQVFHLEIELENNQKPARLLTAKKEIKMIGQSQYVISLNPNFNRELGSAQLVCNNVAGTRYTLYVSQKDQRQELAVISYESNFLGLKGPRKIEVVLSRFEHQMQTSPEVNHTDDYSSEERNATSTRLYNKTPIWSEETHSHALPFEGKNRVMIPSIKNFQIIVKENTVEEQVVMQFGRMSENMFSCDFRYPFSFVQAFAVGLSASETRLFRE